MTPAEAAPIADPYQVGRRPEVEPDRSLGHGEGGPAPTRIVVAYGFWIFLLSDFVMFSAFFATYAVLRTATAGGPGPAQLFDWKNTALETGVLLASSFSCGLMMLQYERKALWPTEALMLLTGLLGTVFLGLEAREFAHMVSIGAAPQRSAFLTSFFTLVGCHGLHVTVGLLWLGTMMAQVWAKGFRQDIGHRVLCFSLFWHALDIIWVAIFTMVYLIGGRA